MNARASLWNVRLWEGPREGTLMFVPDGVRRIQMAGAGSYTPSGEYIAVPEQSEPVEKWTYRDDDDGSGRV